MEIEFEILKKINQLENIFLHYLPNGIKFEKWINYQNISIDEDFNKFISNYFLNNDFWDYFGYIKKTETKEFFNLQIHWELLRIISNNYEKIAEKIYKNLNTGKEN